MKKYFSVVLILLLSEVGMCQTPAHSFESHIKPAYQGLAQTQIETFIAKGDFENYRLQDDRVTLTFDNGFDIVMLSANEMVHLGQIASAASYPPSASVKRKLPVFHMAQNGWVTASYEANPKATYKKR